MDKPTYEQVQDYAKKRRFISNPSEFFDHYQRNGWRKNGQPVYNWQALFQGWEREEKKRRAAEAKPDPQPLQDEEPMTPEEREALVAEVERLKALNLQEIEDYKAGRQL